MNKDIFDKYSENQKFNIEEIPLTDSDYKGIIYEGNFNNDDENVNVKNNISNSITKVKRKQKFNFNIFLSLVTLIGLLTFSTVFYLTYKTFLIDTPTKKNSNDIYNTKSNGESVESKILLDTNQEKELIGFIKDINYTEKEIELYDIDFNKSYFLKVSGSTSLKDKYEQNLVIKEFYNGDIVNFSFDKNNELIYLNKNKDTNEYKMVKSVSIDSINKKINFDNKSFNYSKNIKILKNSELYNLNDINKLDIVNIKTYKNIAYLIEIIKESGTLIFLNKNKISNANIEIDNEIFKNISEIDNLSLTEGTHKIIIKGDNINTFIREVKIKANEENYLDLNEVSNKKGLLLIKSNVSDYSLYINNKLKVSNEPLNLEYGAYKIKIEKSGYIPYEAEILINNPQTNLNIELEKVEYLGKLTVTSEPEGAEVYVNNVFSGYTPLTYKINYGNHSVLIKKSGYKDVILNNVNISENESLFNIVLQKDENLENEKEAKIEEN